MGRRGRPCDGMVLALREVPGDGGAGRHALHHFTASDQRDPARTLLFGFGSGGELAGLPRGADEGLSLVGESEVASDPALRDPDLRGPVYRLSFDRYLERLRRARVNYLKVLVFGDAKPRWSPYATDEDLAQATERTSGISAEYLDRLEELVRAARRSGIVICLSLFSSRMLREPGWSTCPFNARNNNTGDAWGTGAFVAGSPLESFCVIREPPPGRPFDASSVPEKLYLVQRELVTRLVATARRYWNVVYEICDDPRGPGDPAAMAEVVEWHVTVAGWLSALLTDRHGRRRRLVEVNAGPRLRGALLDALGAREDGAGGSLVDLVHLRGEEWGGYPGATFEEARALRRGEEPGSRLLAADSIAAGITHREVAWDGVDGALERLSRRPVAAVLDTEGHHLAQKYPRPYLEIARDRWAHFAYRWTAPYLHRVDVAGETCDRIGTSGQTCPPKGRAGYYGCVTFGLDQRLEECDAPDPAGRTSVFPLPPPAEPPRLLSAVLHGDHLELRFEAPPVAPEGYALFVGSSADGLCEGTDEFPDPLPVEPAPGGGRVRLPTVARPVAVHVAVAAVRGALTSDLSDPIGPIAVAPKGSKLLRADVPAEVESRRDLRGSVTFLNTGTEPWRGAEMGVLLEAQGLSGGLATLFFPMSGANVEDLPDVVPPGSEATIALRRIELSGAFAELYGAEIPALLPYARRPIRFRAAMARRERIPRPTAEHPEVRITPVGEVVDVLPDGRPFEVTVRDPRRLGTRHVVERPQLLGKAFVLPLADGVDRSLHVASVTCAERAPPGTTIRARIALERLFKRPGLAARVLRLAHDGDGARSVEVDVVRLHPIDVYYGLPVRPPRRQFRALAGGAAERIQLAGLEAGYTLTIASSDSDLVGGDVVRWDALAASPVAGGEVAVHAATRGEARVVLFAAELAEDAAAARQTSGALSFGPGDGPRYVALGDGTAHRFLVHQLTADEDAAVRGEILLRAGEDGAFRRELEVSVEPRPFAVTVGWRVLEVPVDAAAASPRTAGQLHPVHAARILAFFDEVHDARQIVETMRDNRACHRDTRRAYAVRPKLAAALMAERDALPGARFSSLAQIEELPGVGPDTFEDIAFTFQDDGTPV